MNTFATVDFDEPQQLKDFIRVLQRTKSFPALTEKLVQVRTRIDRLGEDSRQYTDEDIIHPCYEYSSLPFFLENQAGLGRKDRQRVSSLSILAKGQLYISYEAYLKDNHLETDFDELHADMHPIFAAAAHHLGIDTSLLADKANQEMIPGLDHFNEKLIVKVKREPMLPDLIQLRDTVNSLLNPQ